MTTTVENSVDLNRIRNKLGVNSVAIRGEKIVIDVDPFFSRSVLKDIQDWETNLSLYDVDFEDEKYIVKVSN